MMVQMPDGTMVEQGGPEDRATWWTCTYCKFTGPHVGMISKEKAAPGRGEAGEHRCIGSCCGDEPNPNVPRDPSYWKKKANEQQS